MSATSCLRRSASEADPSAMVHPLRLRTTNFELWPHTLWKQLNAAAVTFVAPAVVDHSARRPSPVADLPGILAPILWGCKADLVSKAFRSADSRGSRHRARSGSAVAGQCVLCSPCRTD